MFTLLKSKYNLGKPTNTWIPASECKYIFLKKFSDRISTCMSIHVHVLGILLQLVHQSNHYRISIYCVYKIRWMNTKWISGPNTQCTCTYMYMYTCVGSMHHNEGSCTVHVHKIKSKALMFSNSLLCEKKIGPPPSFLTKIISLWRSHH